MAFTSEIDKLERRWNENPLGLTFAPYAEACRKAGDIGKALELLEKGLAQHPNYVPAHIVRGRCHLDSQSDGEAEQAFLRAVELDPENVIALKSLAELAERAGRLPEAIRRLEQLLDVDRSNEDARGQLDRVLELQAAPPAVAAPSEDSAPPAPTAEAVSDEPARTIAEATYGEESFDDPSLIELAEPEQERDDSPGRSEWQVSNDSEAIRATEPQMGDIVLGADPPDYSQQTPGEPVDAALLEPPALAPLMPEVEQPFDVLLPPPPIEAEEETVPLPPEPEPVESAVPEVEPEPEPEPVSVPTLMAEPERASELEPAAAPESEPVPEPLAGASEPELVVTASMAEVFLRQGYRELARAVYLQLAERDPSDTRIAAALAELQPEAESPPPPPPVPESHFDATTTGGRSVEQLFSALLSASRPASSATVHPPAFEPPRRPAGEPTRPAQESLSLSAVFGEEAAPAGSSSGSAPAGDGEPSFDEFYAAQGGSSADSELPKGPAAAPSSAPANTPEDLEQFNAWLRGLKR